MRDVTYVTTYIATSDLVANAGSRLNYVELTIVVHLVLHVAALRMWLAICEHLHVK